MRKSFPIVILVAICVCGLAEQSVQAADAQIQQIVDQLDAATYQGFLDNDLYTHDGDNRGFAWNSSASQYEPAPQHDLARDTILGYFNSLGFASSLDPFSFSAGGKTYAGANNVIGVLTGATTPERYVVIGGHYDSVQNPGADDNASGVAGVMEAARIMSQSTFETSIMFVAWDGEEKGLKGSRHWVNTNGVSSISAVFNLDMLAHNNEGLNIASLYGSTEWNAAMTAAATEYVPDLNISDLGSGKAWSDHWPFEAEGVFAGGIIENVSPRNDNPYYHTADDSYDNENYLDFDYAIDLLTVAVAAASDSAGLLPEPATLTWNSTIPAPWTSNNWDPGLAAPAGNEHMVVNSGTAVVSSDLTALRAASLTVAGGAGGGTVSIGPAGLLAVAGSVTVGPGGVMCIDGVLSAGAVIVAGGSMTNSAGHVGLMTVQSRVTLADGATLAIEALGAGVDKLATTGAVTLGPAATLGIIISGGDNGFVAGTYTLIEADDGVDGTFANVTDLGAYVSVNGDGLTYGPAAVTLTLDRDLNPADGNLDGVTDVSDRIIWSSNSFTEGTTFMTGDYNGDGATDVSDRIIWNRYNFTEALAGEHDEQPLAAGNAPVPEPATLSLLVLATLATCRRKRKHA